MDGAEYHLSPVNSFNAEYSHNAAINNKNWRLPGPEEIKICSFISSLSW